MVGKERFWTPVVQHVPDFAFVDEDELARLAPRNPASDYGRRGDSCWQSRPSEADRKRAARAQKKDS